MAKKTQSTATKAKCPISREQFAGKAPKALMVAFTANDDPVGNGIAAARTFDSGSMGWYFGDKVTVFVDGVPCKAQVSLSVTLVGSKDLPKE